MKKISNMMKWQMLHEVVYTELVEAFELLHFAASLEKPLTDSEDNEISNYMHGVAYARRSWRILATYMRDRDGLSKSKNLPLRIKAVDKALVALATTLNVSDIPPVPADKVDDETQWGGRFIVDYLNACGSLIRYFIHLSNRFEDNRDRASRLEELLEADFDPRKLDFNALPPNKAGIIVG